MSSVKECLFWNFMWMYRILGVCVLIFHLCSLQVLGTPVAYPVIVDTPEEIVVNVNTTLQLTCISDHKHMQWIYSVKNENSVIQKTSAMSNDLYSSTLTLKSITHHDVGLFTCLDIHRSNSNASVFVYVKDHDNLLASGEHLLTVFAYHGQKDLVIPCRPSFPDVVVRLETNGEDVLDQPGWSYDPRRGYIVAEATVEDHQSDGFECEGKWQDKNSYLSISVFIESVLDLLPTPNVNISTRVMTGDSFYIECNILLMGSVPFDLKWRVPNTLSNPKIETAIDVKYQSPGQKNITRGLYVSNSSVSDSGEYKCIFTNIASNKTSQSSTVVHVLASTASYLKLTLDESRGVITIDLGETAKLAVKLESIPPATISCTTPNGQVIRNNSKLGKYSLGIEKARLVLTVNDVTLKDVGIYQLSVSNGEETKLLNLTLRLGKPAVELNGIPTRNYYMNGTSYSFVCKAFGYPQPHIKWFYKKCSSIHQCSDVFNTSKQVQYRSRQEFVNGMYTVHNITFIANSSGFLECDASNERGRDNQQLLVVVTDLPRFTYVGTTENFVSHKNFYNSSYREVIEVIEGSSLEIMCTATAFNYTQPLVWVSQKKLNDSSDIQENCNRKIASNATELSHKICLKWKNITSKDSGIFDCIGTPFDSPGEQKNIGKVVVRVKGLKSPVIITPDLNGTTIHKSGSSYLDLKCRAEGIPEPQITWYKDGSKLNFGNSSQHRLMDNGEKLTVLLMSEVDAGIYECRALNTVGVASRNVTVVVEALELAASGSAAALPVSIVVIVIALVILLVLIFILGKKIRQKRSLMAEFYLLASTLEKGNGGLDPALPLDDQALALPYDKKWEIERDRIQMGRLLGSGAFGRVFKGSVRGLVEGQEMISAAVKMTPPMPQVAHVAALVSELKIMTQLGVHPNVLALIGACTGNLLRGELLVIVEYCAHGNLHHFLSIWKEDFLDEVDPETGMLIPRDEVSFEEILLTDSKKADYRNAVKKEGYVNVLSSKCRWEGGGKPLTTSDLVSWGFQVACGMKYLAKIKVLHRDLAARNILLAEGGVVKICDFGLARDTSHLDHYMKKSAGLLPIKWLSPESLAEGVFTSQSDVWSFGIFLWELFSLGESPYPEFDADKEFYNRLESGYRMPKPSYCPAFVYDLMQLCWNWKPQMRPCFDHLTQQLENMLDIQTMKHYRTLNEDYIVSGEQQCSSGGNSNYANVEPQSVKYTTKDVHNQGYLPMSPTWKPSTPRRESEAESEGYLWMKGTEDLLTL